MPEARSPLKSRWWFKLIQFLAVGMIRSARWLIRWYGNLSRKGKWSVALGFAMLILIAGIVGQQENERANRLGFSSVAEMRQAEKAGFHNKATYQEHLRKLAAAEAAAALRPPSGADDEVPGAGSSNASETRTPKSAEIPQRNVSEDDQVDINGTSRRQWRQRCIAFAQAKNECAVADYERRCLDAKMGAFEAGMAVEYCEGSEPEWWKMGSFR